MAALHDQEQFFALAVHCHDVHLRDTWQLSQGLVHVEHGREFDNDCLCLVEQARGKSTDIGCAVLQAIDAVACQVAASRVDVDGVDRLHDLQVLDSIGLHHPRLGQAQQR